MNPLIVKGVVFGLLLACAALWDMKEREIPNLIPAMILVCGLIELRPAASVAGLLVTGGPYLLAALLTHGKTLAIGGGDIKLMGACGFVLGVWPGLLHSILSLILAVLTGVMLFGVRRQDFSSIRLPLAPFFCIGGVMGAVICIVIQNYFMLPVLAAGMGLLPFWYVLFTSHSYKKLMNNEIETGLSIITSSYLRSESMITAVEENIHYLNPPVADVFRGFLAETNMISADVKQALSNMKPKLDNYVFREWVDAAIACQDDKSLKSTLTPIIGKLSDMRIVAAELDYLLYEPFKEFITMAFLLIGNIPLLYFLNKDWYDVLVNTGFGKGILAVCLLVLLISFAAVIRLTKPVEYKR